MARKGDSPEQRLLSALQTGAEQIEKTYILEEKFIQNQTGDMFDKYVGVKTAE